MSMSSVSSSLPVAARFEVQATDLMSVMVVGYDGETVTVDPRAPWSKFIESRERMKALLARIDRDALRNAKGAQT